MKRLNAVLKLGSLSILARDTTNMITTQERIIIQSLPLFDTEEQALAAARPFWGAAAPHHISQYVGNDAQGTKTTKWGVDCD